MTADWQQVEQGEILFKSNFFSHQESDHLFKALRAELPWEQRSIKMFGKSVLQPRLQAWCGDANYTYSGLTMRPTPWTPELLFIKSRIESVCDVQFNSVLVNLYRSGEDYMGWHSDNEKELGRNPVIASVSLGASRRFLLKHKSSGKTLEYLLDHGDLFTMGGQLQEYWKHSLPKMRKVNMERINLTFRSVIG